MDIAASAFSVCFHGRPCEELHLRFETASAQGTRLRLLYTAWSIHIATSLQAPLQHAIHLLAGLLQDLTQGKVAAVRRHLRALATILIHFFN